MTDLPDSPNASNAAAAVALMAIDPAAVGGALVRSRSAAVRERCLAALLALMPEKAPVRRMPGHVTEERMIGGLDLAGTLSSGRPVASRGLLTDADCGVLVLPGAEALAQRKVSLLTAAMDEGLVRIERDGLSNETKAAFGVLAFDEGPGGEEAVSAALSDRLAFLIDLESARGFDIVAEMLDAAQIEAARALIPRVSAGEEAIEALCKASIALGIVSLRVPILAVRAARHSAALFGRLDVGPEDLELAAKLVLAPRATRLPAEPEKDAPPESDRDQQEQERQDGERDLTEQELEDMVLAAVAAALPPDVLARLRNSQNDRLKSNHTGRQGAEQKAKAKLRGRPQGVRPGKPGNGARLNVIETLRAAAPWQKLRREAQVEAGSVDSERRLKIRSSDFRITHTKHRSETTTIFAVDGSGSSALHRMGEAKGAVELLLAECYVRRDRVALLAFRGDKAELLLAPTRSLVRAKRALAALPGGGATPLASAVDCARQLAEAEKGRGRLPTVVLLTDGKANMARDGKKGRAAGQSDALEAARPFRAGGFKSLVIDTSPKRAEEAEQLARALGAEHIVLPHGRAADITRAVRQSAAV